MVASCSGATALLACRYASTRSDSSSILATSFRFGGLGSRRGRAPDRQRAERPVDDPLARAAHVVEADRRDPHRAGAAVRTLPVDPVGLEQQPVEAGRVALADHARV